MKKYDYRAAVLADVKDYINDNAQYLKCGDREKLEEALNDELFLEDRVTGNASGSYTFSAYEAEEKPLPQP